MMIAVHKGDGVLGFVYSERASVANVCCGKVATTGE